MCRADSEDGARAHLSAPTDEQPAPGAPYHPYLLRDLEITRPGHVWCADITYLPMRRGFLYLVAIMDWASRKVLAWRLSNTMDAAFCVRKRWRFGRPEIFNTDQGVSSPAPTSPTCCAMPKCGSAWTDAAAGWTACFCEAALAVAEVRMRLPERVRDRLRIAGWARPVAQLLQRTSASLPLRRPNPRRGVWAGRRNTISGACPGYRAHHNDGVNHPGIA